MRSYSGLGGTERGYHEKVSYLGKKEGARGNDVRTQVMPFKILHEGRNRLHGSWRERSRGMDKGKVE